MQKFAKVLPKDDLKKFAKEVGKKLVASDFKNNRVEDPTKISEHQEKKVKKFVREYFEKVVQKKKAADKRKREKLANGTSGPTMSIQSSPAGDMGTSFSNGTPTPSIPPSPMVPPDTPIESPDTSRKRTRESEDTPDDDSNKRFKEGDDESVPTPPPPPPPPTDDILDAEAEPIEETEEEKELQKQEEDLMRENEEAIKMDLDGNLGTSTAVESVDEHQLAELMERNKEAFGGNNGVVAVNGTSHHGGSNGNESGHGGEKMEGLETGAGHEREEVMSH